MELKEVVSVTRQVVNGFIWVFIVKLADGGGCVGQYKITYFEKHGKPENPEVTIVKDVK